jgi:hypothetical protein
LGEQSCASLQALQDNRDGLDEAFLASCFAYIQKASEDNLDDVVVLIQRVLQMYAARQWSQADADGKHDALLLDILTADPQNWHNMIHDLAMSGPLLTLEELTPGTLPLCNIQAFLAHDISGREYCTNWSNVACAVLQVVAAAGLACQH